MNELTERRHKLRISVLYFQGCPNHGPTVEKVRAVVSEFGLDAQIREAEVTGSDDLERLRFLGSPTVQVDGADIEPAARSRTDYAMSCRVYATPNGLPSRAMLLSALGLRNDRAPDLDSTRGTPGARQECCAADRSADPAAGSAPSNQRRLASAATAASLATAVLSSACCWLPLLLLALGASGMGAAVFFGFWRPVFVIVAVSMLGLSFYLTFVRKPAATGACCSGGVRRRGRFQRSVWYASAVVVAAFVLFPGYVGRLIGGPPAEHDSTLEDGPGRFVFEVEGMHCAACAVSLAARLASVEGVDGARVDYASRRAYVTMTDRSGVERVVDSVRKAGYTATLRTP